MVGCGDKKEETVDIDITALKGPTAMGMVKMMEDSGAGTEETTVDGNSYHFTIAASVDEVTPKLVFSISMPFAERI